MRIGRLIVCALLILGNGVSLAPRARALDASGIVISHIIGGEASHAGSELLALYNNSDVAVDVTGYCVKDGDRTAASLACIQADPNTRVFVPAHKYLTVVSNVFMTLHPLYTPDTTYVSPDNNSSKIAVGGDTVTLVDGAGTELDQVTWGSGKLATGGILVRKETAVGSGVLVDTNSTSDFTSASSFAPGSGYEYPGNASYDVVTIVDLCPNLDGVQQTLPGGYLVDEQGGCQPDSCVNLPGLQVSVPDHYDADASGNCIQHDECDNISGIQSAIPDSMVRTGYNDCVWDIRPLIVTEVLPNAVGSDAGNEFIEVYNPTDRMINLSLYSVAVGLNGEKTYAFPVGATIAPGEYRAFTDSAMKFTLVNTTSRVQLRAIDGSTLGDTGTYESPAEGESWALLDGAWQYTNQPTPGAANQLSVNTEPDATDMAATSCPAGKYRNPLTNRCRLIAADAAVLATCDADQYRNPETGRCKKITTISLAPCKDGQYRSEETNRCRNIVTASTQKPCKDNQYRSEETNRCRNLSANTVPESAFAVQPVKDGALAFVGWWALGGVGLLAAGYGCWEWRHEIMSAISQFSVKR